MKIAVFGGSGQVATELARRMPDGVTLERIGRDRADFARPKEVYDVTRALDVDAIVNAAAYTAVDKAEEEGLLATTINGTSVGSLAKASAEIGTPVVHISTDYVFSGEGDRPWKPDDPLAPKGLYGKSKLIGEKELVKFGDTYVVLRTSWVFSAHGSNFVKTMLRLGSERDVLRIVDDQVGGPTPAAAIADACYGVAAALVGGAPGGVHHFAGAPDISWAGFASEIFTAAGLATQVDRIGSSDYPTPAERPKNSRLDCRSLGETYGIARPDWRVGLNDVLKELGVT
ncbi:MAG: dTDP-4-dehydrorhamnose reductase [Paracoccaceae bacterium]|nr:dTDP-4-dehydrorhamnose reductase [Paracoccaceae bacterium]